MASGAAGSLVVTLGLDAAQFSSGLTKAEYQVRRFGEQLGDGLRTAGTYAVAGLATVATAATVAAVAFDGLIKAAGDFQDLAEKTGGSAEGLASLAVSAAVGGTSMEAVAAASVKLTKNLTGVDDESKAAGAAIGALGLNLKDFKNLAPEDQLETVAKALNGFEDGAGKTAVAVALLGKSGADLLPFLKELGNEGGRQIILTAEQIKQADDYADKQAKAKAQLGLYAQAIATQFLPAVTALTGAFTDMIKETVGVSDAASKLANQNAVQKFAEDAVENLSVLLNAVQLVARGFDILGTGIGATAATASALLNRDFKGAATIQVEAAKDMFNKVATIGDNLISDRLKKSLAAQKALAAQARQENRGFDPNAKQLNFNGATPKGGGAGDDPTKKILDNQLKALENAASEEADILRSRNKMLDLYNGEALISTQDYYAGRRAAQEQAVANQTALFDQEIKALQDYQAKAGKATDREGAQGKINDLLAKKAKLSRDAGEAAIELGFKERKSAEDMARTLGEVNAQVLELQGNLVEASNIRFDIQNAEKLKRFMADGNEEAVKQVAYLKQITAAQAQLNQVQESFGRSRTELQRAEERISRDQQNGTLGQIDALSKLGSARETAIEGMKRSFADLQKLEASGVQLTARQRDSMADLAYQIEDLSTRLDPLADKFNTIFTEGLGNAFGDFITGAKDAKTALKDFGTSVVNQIGNLVAQNLASTLFKSVFGTTSGGGGAAGFNFGSILSSLFGGGKASGGIVEAGSLYPVNERGPELLDVNGRQMLMMGNSSGRVTANNRISDGGGFTQNIQYVVQGKLDTSTQTQTAQRNRAESLTVAARF